MTDRKGPLPWLNLDQNEDCAAGLPTLKVSVAFELVRYDVAGILTLEIDGNGLDPEKVTREDVLDAVKRMLWVAGAPAVQLEDGQAGTFTLALKRVNELFPELVP